MPEIGRPERENPYSGIQRGPRRASSDSMRADTSSVGEQLNRIAGRAPESRYKSYEEHTQLDKDGFLKLLSHQLQNQNPMEPMDQKEFAADLAQFSQLEQMTNVNANIEKLGKNANQEEKFYGASFLGKKVFTEGSSISYSGGAQGSTIPFYLNQPATNVLVRLYDGQGQLISQIEREGMSEGSHNIHWDGVSTDGTRASGGNYTVEVNAWDEGGGHFTGETQSSGLVTGVQFEHGETILVVDGERRVFLRDVKSFQMPDDPQLARQQVQEQAQQLMGSENLGHRAGGEADLGSPAAKKAGLPQAAQDAYNKQRSQDEGPSHF